MTRDEALEELRQKPYDDAQVEEDLEYIAKKLEISKEELRKYISGENKTYRDYKNSFKILRMFIKIATLLGIEKRNFR